MTLELSKLSGRVQEMGQALAVREQEYTERVARIRRWLSEYADRGDQLCHPARKFHAAIPTGEPLDAEVALPSAPERFTFIAADGAQIQPDSHGIAFYYLLNIGALVYRHGSDQTPEAYSLPALGFAEDEIYEHNLPVTGNLLDLERDLAEITCLADLCTSEPPGTTTVAVVDGTLILWTLKDTPQEYQDRKIHAYLQQLERIRRSGAVVAACISRPRRSEVARLAYLAHVDGDVAQAESDEDQSIKRIPDHAIFEPLPPGARSALFASPSAINHGQYAPDHTVHFFYLNMASEGRDAAIARIEVPAWVADDASRLASVHGAIVAQARITGDYPYALVRADELAFISSREREAFEHMVASSLVRAGVRTALSPKQYYKTLTRQGKRKFR